MEPNLYTASDAYSLLFINLIFILFDSTVILLSESNIFQVLYNACMYKTLIFYQDAILEMVDLIKLKKKKNGESC